MHEEDFGVLWKHTDLFTGIGRDPPAAPPGDLLLHHHRQLRLRLLLVPLPRRHHRVRGQGHRRRLHLRLPGTATRTPPRSRPGLGAPFHQHLFCARLDMAVDGVTNARRGGGRGPACRWAPDNPCGNAFTRQRTPLTRESEAPRTADAARRPGLAHHQPGAPQPARASRSATRCTPRASRRCWPTRTRSIARRAAFATKHLWVTRYDPAERYPAGDFVNQHPGGAGLPAYVADDRPTRRRGHRRCGTPSA